MLITLKDNVVKEYQSGTTAYDIAKDISAGLARAACAAKIDGKVCDLRTCIDKDSSLEILTFDDEDGRRAFRHTASHILAQAVKRLFPDAKLAIGPAIENGFYYDFDVETPFTADDLVKIEAEMKKIVKEGAEAVQGTRRQGRGHKLLYSGRVYRPLRRPSSYERFADKSL